MPPVSRRWLWRGLLAAMVVVVIAGGALAYVLAHAPGNVSHPNLQFTIPTTTTTTTAPTPTPHAKRKVNNFQWPLYGFNGGRTRVFAAPANVAPPVHVGWRFDDRALLEFPPVIYHETMFVVDDDCAARAINLNNGHVRWFRKIGTLCATSPATAPKAGLVVMPVLAQSGHTPGNGRFVALSMKNGHIVWSRPAGPGTESSPIVHGITVYYGDQGGTLYARNVANGHLYWTYHAKAAIKGGPALAGGNLYFGDYAGRAYAVNSVSGRQVWAVGTSGTQFGFGSGNFYATPAVAFGRVYMGNTDGRVYSFGARNGALAWATATRGYVYSSAAVADPKGLGPTVYVGSYDGNMYAFNAQSGSVRWKQSVGGRISGSSTVIGNVVYFSNLGNRTTIGLNDVTGRRVFSFPDGAFTPIIADYHALYLDGYTTIYQLLPGAKPTRQARRKARRRAAAAHHAAKHARHKRHATRAKHKRQARRAKHKRQTTHAKRKRQARRAKRATHRKAKKAARKRTRRKQKS